MKSQAANEEQLSSEESLESSDPVNEPIRREQAASSTNQKTESDSDVPVVRTYVLVILQRIYYKIQFERGPF